MITALPKLYKRTNTGAVQQWTIHYTKDGRYFTTSGQIDGKMVTSNDTQCEGKNIGKKNETTPQQQAELEARSKWQKKVDAGYMESILTIDSQTTRYNPMLAKGYDDYKDEIEFPVFSQPKLDGLRCVITRDGAYSRLWKKFVTLDHIRETLQPIFDRFPEIDAFDGEIYSHDLKDNFEKIVSLVKRTKASKQDIEECRQKVEYHVYDLLNWPPSPFWVRTKAVKNMLSGLNGIKVVKTTKVLDETQLDQLFQEYLEEGYEGQMIRTSEAYYQTKRTSDLLKRKTFQDKEFPIVGFKEGIGNRKGCIVLQLKNLDGQLFDSVPVGPVPYLMSLWKSRNQLIGKMAVVKYQNLSSEGIPRFNNTVKIRETNLEEWTPKN